MAELDHLVYACKDVTRGTATIETLTGVTAVVGGPHVGRGSHNTLLTFDERTYFEIIGIDPDQPEPSQPRPFGLDELESPGLVGFAIHPVEGESLEDLIDAVRSAGFDPGTKFAMSRRKPDGELLEWELSTGGDTADGLHGAVPFMIDWLGQPSPATTLPSMGSLEKFIVHNPDERVGTLLEALGLGDTVDFDIGEPRLEARILSPNGMVALT